MTITIECPSCHKNIDILVTAHINNPNNKQSTHQIIQPPNLKDMHPQPPTQPNPNTPATTNHNTQTPNNTTTAATFTDENGIAWQNTTTQQGKPCQKAYLGDNNKTHYGQPNNSYDQLHNTIQEKNNQNKQHYHNGYFYWINQGPHHPNYIGRIKTQQQKEQGNDEAV